MKSLKSTVMVFFWVVLCLLFFNSYSNSYAQAPVGNEIWKLISPPPDFTEFHIIAVHKVSDNNFYILSEGLLGNPVISGTERNVAISLSARLYQYLNGTWNLITFDPNHVPLYGIGGKGSTAYAVGLFGSVYRITGTTAEFWNSWNALYSNVDLHDVYVADDGTVYAVGQKNNMELGFEPCAFQNNGLNDDWIELPFSGLPPGGSSFTKMSGNGGHQFAAVGWSSANPYNIAYFFSNGSLVPISLPPGCSNGYLHAVDYYLNTYRMAGDTGGVIEFSPERSVTSCMDGTFDPNTSIRGLYDNFAVGGDYPSMSRSRGDGLLNGKIFQYINGEWREDPYCPEGFGMFYDIDGGSDIYVVGAYGAILSRDQQASASVPTLSQWGMIIFLMAFVTMGLIALRRKNASFGR